MSAPKNKPFVPIPQKYLLDFYEAAEYFGIGINRIRDLTKEPDCEFAVKTSDRKTKIIRTKFEDYISEHRII